MMVDSINAKETNVLFLSIENGNRKFQFRIRKLDLGLLFGITKKMKENLYKKYPCNIKKGDK